jgi:hypothetical protein
VADQVKHRKNGDEPPINLNKAWKVSYS